jgi:hypothetical protein
LRILLALLLLFDICITPLAAQPAQPVMWNLANNARARVIAESLTLTPEDAAWDRAVAVASNPITFWSSQCAILHSKLSFRAAPRNAARDISAFVGFTSNGSADSYQAADNVVGLYIEYSGKRRRIFTGLARKEKNGEAEISQGNESGNLALYVTPLVEIPVDGDSAVITLTVTDAKVTAAIAGTPFTQTAAAGLTAAFWKRAYPIAQCMNNNEGRGAITFEKTSLAAQTSHATDADEIDYKKRPPDSDLITSLASAIGTVTEMMLLYSHPRVVGSTWHQFLHASYVSKSHNLPFSQWGEQTEFITDEDKYITTPPAEAVKMFIAFAKGATLMPITVSVPKRVHYLCADDARGKRYFVVNATNRPVTFRAAGATHRSTLCGGSPTATSILHYGKYGAPGDINPITPHAYPDPVLPAFSVSVVN